MNNEIQWGIFMIEAEQKIIQNSSYKIINSENIQRSNLYRLHLPIVKY